MSDDDNEKRRFERMADKAVAEAGKVRRELGRSLANASAKDPSVLSRKALARLGPEGATAYVDELRRLFGRPSSVPRKITAKVMSAGSQTPPDRPPHPPETIEGWRELRCDKRSPVAEGVLAGLTFGSVLLVWSTLRLALAALL